MDLIKYLLTPTNKPRPKAEKKQRKNLIESLFNVTPPDEIEIKQTAKQKLEEVKRLYKEQEPNLRTVTNALLSPIAPQVKPTIRDATEGLMSDPQKFNPKMSTSLPFLIGSYIANSPQGAGVASSAKTSQKVTQQTGKKLVPFLENILKNQPLKPNVKPGSYSNIRGADYQEMLNPDQMKRVVGRVTDKVGDYIASSKVNPRVSKLEEGRNIGSSSDIGKQLDDSLYRSANEVTNKPNFVNDRNYVRKKVNFFDKLRTPENVLRKIGLGDEADLIRKADESYKTNLKQEITQIEDWIKRVPGKESTQKIFKYLDGQAIDLSQEEYKVAKEMRDSLSSWAEKLKLPEDRRISNYITHIFERGQIEKEIDPELARLINKSEVAGSVYNPFKQGRKEAPNFIEDAFRAYEAYIKRGTREFNMNPALEKLKQSSKDLDRASLNYVEKYSHRLNMRPTELDEEIDNFIKSTPVGYRAGQRPVTTVSKNLRQWIYRGALGLNPASAIINLSQGANTFAKLGTKNTTKGYLHFLRKGKEGVKELVDNGVLDDNFIQDRQLSAYKSFFNKLDKGLFVFFDTAEKINRGSAYFGAKAKALQNGMSEKEAVEFAKKLVRETQFSYSSVDTPLVLSSDIGKTLGQFLTYPLKQAEFLGGMIKNKEVSGLIKWATATLVFYNTLGKVIGRDTAEAIPFSGIISGQDKFNTPAIQIAGNLRDVLSPNEDIRDRGGQGLPKTASLLFPAGVQIKKSYEGLDAFSRGASTTRTGRIRYRVPQTKENLLRMILFGQYSIPEAREYFDKIKK